ncbi:MAG: hypothetical protein II622_06520, partial [Thermoguttaceae bacterium]|nr:hypothetical protein [Thermoguttaceae bacterium]
MFLGIDIVLKSMCDFINTSSNTSGFSVIVNNNGKVIIAPESNEFFKITTSEEAIDLREVENKDLAEFVRKALAEPTDLTLVRIGDKEYYVAGAPMPTVGWTVISVVAKEVTETPEKTMLAEYDRINDEASAKFRESSDRTKHSGRIIMVLVFLFSVGAALVAANRIVKPLEEMTDTIKDSSKTGRLFEMKDCYRTNDEIEVLAESFADLSQKTKQYIEDITEITK